MISTPKNVLKTVKTKLKIICTRKRKETEVNDVDLMSDFYTENNLEASDIILGIFKLSLPLVFIVFLILLSSSPVFASTFKDIKKGKRSMTMIELIEENAKNDIFNSSDDFIERCTQYNIKTKIRRSARDFRTFKRNTDSFNTALLTLLDYTRINLAILINSVGRVPLPKTLPDYDYKPIVNHIVENEQYFQQIPVINGVQPKSPTVFKEFILIGGNFGLFITKLFFKKWLTIPKKIFKKNYKVDD